MKKNTFPQKTINKTLITIKF